MAERLVLDTGPILALARGLALDVVAQLPFDFVSPFEVRTELDEGARRGYSPIATQWIHFEPLASPINPLVLAEFGAGEAAVMQLAVEQRIAVVVIDEKKGRRAARAIGLKVTGTLGLLGYAKACGLVPAVRPFVERMQAELVWFDEGLVRRVLEGLDE
jgi:hypothetical protein